MNGSLYKSRFTIASLYEAILVSGQQLDAPAQPCSVNSERNQEYNFMGSCALPYYNRRTSRIEHGTSCAGRQLALEKDIIGSRGEKWAFEARDMIYAQDDFLDHFRWCEQAQLLWKSSDEGKKEPPELPEAARRRGFFSKWI
jgi:hypothetical protein